jgi:hypothetical protein
LPKHISKSGSSGRGWLPEQSPIQLLASLCETDPPQVSGQHLDHDISRARYRRLIDVGALVEIGVSTSVLCLACDEPHIVNVEHTGDGGYRAYCPSAGFSDFAASALKRYAVSEPWIAKAIASSLGRTPRTGLADVTHHIGKTRIGPHACHLFFARLLSDRRRLSQAKKEVDALVGNAPSLLLTTTPADLIDGVRPARCALVQLDSVLFLENGRARLELDPLLAALRGPQREQAGATGFLHSPGFRSVTYGEQPYEFSDKQAQVVEALYNAWKSGTPRLHQSEIQGIINSSRRMTEIFRRHPAYGVLIKYDGAGHYWLEL